jgi:hypothetical protein
MDLHLAHFKFTHSRCTLRGICAVPGEHEELEGLNKMTDRRFKFTRLDSFELARQYVVLLYFSQDFSVFLRVCGWQKKQVLDYSFML